MFSQKYPEKQNSGKIAMLTPFSPNISVALAILSLLASVLGTISPDIGQAYRKVAFVIGKSPFYYDKFILHFR